MIQFPGEGDSLIDQVRTLAASLGLPWNEEAARELFDQSLVRNRSPLRDSSPAYDLLLKRAKRPRKVPAINLHSLKLSSEPKWPLPTHLGPRHGRQRNQLWEMAHFAADPEPRVVEVLLEGARPGGKNRPGVLLRQVEVKSPLAVGAVLMRDRLRPHGIVAHGLLAGRSISEIEFFFRSLYVNTDPLAELFVDVPDPQGKGLLSASPPPADHPRPSRVQEVAIETGWEHLLTERLSPGRSGMFLRKRVLTDKELIPVVTDLIAGVQRIADVDERLSTLERSLEAEGIRPRQAAATPGETENGSITALRTQLAATERDLERLRSRRSVRMALAMARPSRGIFRLVRSWKKKR